MKPLKIEFQAFGPYADCEVVDFESLSSKGLFLICGKTGIGKTMILDAMTFALYGKSSGHGRDDFEAMRCTKADFKKTTYVKFEFENNGEFYLFERRLERKTKKLSPVYNVSIKGDDGIWRTLMENPKEKNLNQKAVEIIGLDYDQFRQVIVLPQGQFEKLLTSNSDEKEKILTSIFGEEKWQIIAEKMYRNADDRKRELDVRWNNIKTRLSEEGCETTEQLELLINQKNTELNTMQEEYEKSDCKLVIEKNQGLLALINRFGDLHKTEKILRDLKNQKEDRAEWQIKVNNAERAEKVKSFIEANKKALSDFEARKKAEKESEDEEEKKKLEAKGISDQLNEHLAKENEIEELKRQKAQYEGKKSIYTDIENIKIELKTRTEAVKSASDKEDMARKKSKAYILDIDRLKSEYDAMDAEHKAFLDRYLAGITGELAAELKEGEPCPVCGSTNHPHKASVAENSVTKAMVGSKKKAAEQKYKDLQEMTGKKEEADKLVDDIHASVEEAKRKESESRAKLEHSQKNLVEGVSTLAELDKRIAEFDESIRNYEKTKEKLTSAEKDAKEAATKAETQKNAAESETKRAKSNYEKTEAELKKALEDNGFKSVEEAEELLLSGDEVKALSTKIAEYDAAVKTAKGSLNNLKEELKGKEEPDEDESRQELEKAQQQKLSYETSTRVLGNEIDRLTKKLDKLKKDSEGLDEAYREATEDLAFAKSLRGDTGTGLQRYVLGIMFSSVVSAANKMLEMVHGGRYRLFRSDDKAQGSNKRGLELKVYDKNSEDHDGRFVSTLSGGEKFLTSLALSIGMSTVAQKSGIKIEALFIDEGFGSLDEDSIEDAMNVLKSIQEANGLVGIISHVQILQDQIPSKLRVEKDGKGSHIVQMVG